MAPGQRGAGTRAPTVLAPLPAQPGTYFAPRVTSRPLSGAAVMRSSRPSRNRAVTAGERVAACSAAGALEACIEGQPEGPHLQRVAVPSRPPADPQWVQGGVHSVSPGLPDRCGASTPVTRLGLAPLALRPTPARTLPGLCLWLAFFLVAQAGNLASSFISLFPRAPPPAPKPVGP